MRANDDGAMKLLRSLRRSCRHWDESDANYDVASQALYCDLCFMEESWEFISILDFGWERRFALGEDRFGAESSRQHLEGYERVFFTKLKKQFCTHAEFAALVKLLPFPTVTEIKVCIFSNYSLQCFVDCCGNACYISIECFQRFTHSNLSIKNRTSEVPTLKSIVSSIFLHFFNLK